MCPRGRVALLLTTLALAQAARETHASGTAWAIETPFDAASVFGFAQAPDGALWVASQRGVVRWNGRDAELFDEARVAAFPRGRQVFAAAVDASGLVWLACGDAIEGEGLPGTGELVVLDRGAVQNIPALAGLRGARVATLLADGEGVWIGASTGLFRFDRASASLTDATKTLEVGRASVVRLAAGTAGRLLVATGSEVIELGRNAMVEHRWALPATRAVAMARDGTTWAANPAGVHALSPGAVPMLLTDAALAGRDVLALAIDREDALWIGTWTGLLRRTSDGSSTRLGRAEGLPDERVQAVVIDAEGGVWAGTRAGGVARIHRPLVRSFGPPEGAPSGYAHAVVAGPDGVVWAASSRGLLSFAPRQADVVIDTRPFPRELGAAAVVSLAGTDDGDVWLASAGAGLFRWSERTKGFRGYDRAAGLPDPDLGLVFVDADGALWLAGTRRGLTRVRPIGDRLEILERHETESCTEGITTAARGPSGVWFATRRGELALARKASFACVPAPASVPRGLPFAAFHEDAGGVRWLGVGADAGLVRWRGDDVRAFREEDGLLCDSIAAIVDDGRGHLWTPCGRGVQRFDREALLRGAGRVWPLRVSGETGLRAAETSLVGFPRAAIDRDGRLWLATIDGIATIEPPEGAETTALPKPRVVSVQIAGVDVAAAVAENGMRSVVARGAPVEVSVIMEAPTMTAARGVRLRWRWRGAPHEGGLARAGEPVALGSLAVGVHELEVVASDGYGRFAAAFSPALRVEVRPRLLEAPWFRALAASLLVGLAGLAWWRRARRLAGQRRAVQAERERIARDLHDGLGQGFASLGLHLGSIARQIDERLAGDVPPRLGKALERTHAIVRHMRGEAREAVWNLRAEALGATNLGAAALALAQEMSGEGGLVIALEGALRDPAFTSGSSYVDHELAQIARECLANAIKHGRARRIVVRAEPTDQQLAFTVEDDGVGFSPAEVVQGRLANDGHFGILGIEERTRRMEGKVELVSAPGAGTRVVVTVPSNQS